MNKNIEIRNEEIDEILERQPTWIVKYGILLFSTIILLLIILAYFYKYPDLINGRVTIVSENIPVNIIAKQNGKISNILIKDKDAVEEEQILAIIENTANYKDIIWLKKELNLFNEDKYLSFISQNLNLGELQETYSSLQKKISDYKNIKNKELNETKIQSIENQIKNNKNLLGKFKNQYNLYQQQELIAHKQYIRDSLLFSEKTISEIDLEKSKKEYISKQLDYEKSKTYFENLSITIENLKQQIIDIEIQQNLNYSQIQSSIIETVENLKAEILNWEEKYIIKSPIKGIVCLSKIWEENQEIKIGEKILGIAPKENPQLYAKLNIPVYGAGKVKAGQNVFIKLDNYPHMEYGEIKGQITNISLLPDESVFIAEVELLDDLNTTHGKKLEYIHEMQGNAKIITENKRLIFRLFEKVIYWD